eukprot:g17901.t1
MDETQLIDEEQAFAVHGHVDGLVDGDGLDQAEQILNLSDHDADTGGGRPGFSAQDLRNHNVHNLKSVAELGIVMDNLYNEMKHHKPGNTGGRGRPAADWPAISRPVIKRKWHDFKSRHNIPTESKMHNTEALGKLCLELIHERYWVSPPTLTFAQLQGKEDLQQYLDLEAANAAADKKARTTMLQKLRKCGHGADELRTFFADLRDNPARALLFTKYSIATGRGSGEKRLEHYMSFLATASQRVTQSTKQMMPLCDRFRSEGLDLTEFAAECASSKEEAGRGDCVVVAGEAVDLDMQKELQKERLFNDARVLCGDLKLSEAVADLQMRQKEAAKEKSSRRRLVERAEDMTEQVAVFSQKSVALQFQQPSSERTRSRLACGEQLQALIGAAVFPDASSGAGSRVSEEEAWRRFDKIIAKGKLCVPDDTDTAEDPGENAEDSSAALEQLGKEIDELFGIGCDELGGAGNGAALRSGSQNSASDALRRKLEAFTGPLEVDPALLPEEKWPELLPQHVLAQPLYPRGVESSGGWHCVMSDFYSAVESYTPLPGSRVKDHLPVGQYGDSPHTTVRILVTDAGADVKLFCGELIMEERAHRIRLGVRGSWGFWSRRTNNHTSTTTTTTSWASGSSNADASLVKNETGRKGLGRSPVRTATGTSIECDVYIRGYGHGSLHVPLPADPDPYSVARVRRVVRSDADADIYNSVAVDLTMGLMILITKFIWGSWLQGLQCTLGSIWFSLAYWFDLKLPQWVATRWLSMSPFLDGLFSNWFFIKDQITDENFDGTNPRPENRAHFNRARDAVATDWFWSIIKGLTGALSLLQRIGCRLQAIAFLSVSRIRIQEYVSQCERLTLQAGEWEASMRGYVLCSGRCGTAQKVGLVLRCVFFANLFGRQHYFRCFPWLLIYLVGESRELSAKVARLLLSIDILLLDELSIWVRVNYRGAVMVLALGGEASVRLAGSLSSFTKAAVPTSQGVEGKHNTSTFVRSVTHNRAEMTRIITRALLVGAPTFPSFEIFEEVKALRDAEEDARMKTCARSRWAEQSGLSKGGELFPDAHRLAKNLDLDAKQIQSVLEGDADPLFENRSVTLQRARAILTLERKSHEDAAAFIDRPTRMPQGKSHLEDVSCPLEILRDVLSEGDYVDVRQIGPELGSLVRPHRSKKRTPLLPYMALFPSPGRPDSKCKNLCKHGLAFGRDADPTEYFKIDWGQHKPLSSVIEFAAVDAGRLFSQNVDLDIAPNFTILKYDDRGHALFLQVSHSSWKTVKVKPADVVVEVRKGFSEDVHERTAHENPGGRQVFEVSWKDFNIEVLVPERREAAIRDCYMYFVPSISSWICRVPLSWRQKRRGKGATVAKQKNFGRTALRQGSSAPTTIAIAKARQLVISDVCKLLQILPPQTTCDEEKAAAAEMTSFLEARASVAAENNEEEADLKKELKYIDLKPGYLEEDVKKLTKGNTKKATPCKPPGGGKSNLMKSSGKKMPPPSFLPVKKNQDKQRAQATKGNAKQPSSQFAVKCVFVSDVV